MTAAELAGVFTSVEFALGASMAIAFQKTVAGYLKETLLRARDGARDTPETPPPTEPPETEENR